MKFFSSLVFFSLVFFSCSKSDCDGVAGSIDGSWKMISVKDNATGVMISKPGSLQGDVIVTFKTEANSTGSFTGNTPTNILGPDKFSIGPNNALNIQVLTMTKVMETPWGQEFVDNIRESQTYGRSGDGRLMIKTRSRSLTFINF